MVDAWINCAGCGNRFGAFARQCPKCGLEQQKLSQPVSSGTAADLRTAGPKKKLIITLVIVALLVVVTSALSISFVRSSGIINLTQQQPPALPNLKEYALQRINEDRAKFSLLPVKLSQNDAAQVHAEDILKTEQISHWMTNGEKPYMTYTRYNGLGYVAQNIVIQNTVGGDIFEDSRLQACKKGWALCDKLDPKKAVEKGEYAMMYEDKECCADGHRRNILDKHHTDASIGIAYDSLFFVMVENFENNYIEFNQPILTKDNSSSSRVHISGILSNNDEVNKLTNVIVYYDETPAPLVYEQNKEKTSYSLGEAVAGIAPPHYFFNEINTLQAERWAVYDKSIDIQFDLTPIITKKGVYTIVTNIEDKDGNQFPATSYSIFVK